MSKVSKRTIDVSISAVALVLVSPILIYASYKIKKEDNGPVLFKQKRSGLNNELFEMYKFRSMKKENNIIGTYSEERRNPFENWKDKVPDEFVFKSTSGHNPNVTEIGQFIRKYSIDELPQLINVLKGEMSIVGPRPEIIEISKYYNSHQLKRLEVKPGITGWAQVNGRSDMNHGEKLEYDLWYVQNQKFFLDIKIIFSTFLQLFTGKGSV